MEVVGANTASPSYNLMVPQHNGAPVQVTESSALQAFNAQTSAGVSDVQGLVTAMWSETRTEIMGDLAAMSSEQPLTG